MLLPLLPSLLLPFPLPEALLLLLLHQRMNQPMLLPLPLPLLPSLPLPLPLPHALLLLLLRQRMNQPPASLQGLAAALPPLPSRCCFHHTPHVPAYSLHLSPPHLVCDAPPYSLHPSPLPWMHRSTPHLHLNHLPHPRAPSYSLHRSPLPQEQHSWPGVPPWGSHQGHRPTAQPHLSRSSACPAALPPLPRLHDCPLAPPPLPTLPACRLPTPPLQRTRTDLHHPHRLTPACCCRHCRRCCWNWCGGVQRGAMYGALLTRRGGWNGL